MNRLLQVTALASLVFSAPLMAQDHSHHTQHGDHTDHTTMNAAEVSHSQSIYQIDALWNTHQQSSLKLSELAGTPVIISMIYGSCTTACPVLVHDAKRLYNSLDEATQKQVKLVMVSFDTARDTPEALADYAKQYNLNNNWLFLNGSEQDIRTLATVLGVRYRQRPDGDFDHSNLVSILDKHGVIAERIEGLSQPMEKPAQLVTQLAKMTVQ
ncbi:SCO family protein [Idiomarina seosinensis]|uniref:SCO family protein n=1 Tax=Idiomarina seosinensis TaxID=281739 RepID=A0A432ZIR8_9GAMM|nr:SCO family protein [Idiomarina seosinensis]RUO77861.1 SCO family protein [Idiomarina seosinensis]